MPRHTCAPAGLELLFKPFFLFGRCRAPCRPDGCARETREVHVRHDISVDQGNDAGRIPCLQGFVGLHLRQCFARHLLHHGVGRHIGGKGHARQDQTGQHSRSRTDEGAGKNVFHHE